MDLLHFLRVLGKRKWLISSVVLVAIVTTFLVTRKMPRTYQAKAQLATGITEQTGPTPIGWTPQLQWFEIDGKFNNLIERIKSNQSIALLSYELVLHDLESTEPFADLSPLQEKYTEEELRKAALLFHRKLDSIQPLVKPGEVDALHVQVLEDLDYHPKTLQEELQIARDADTDFIGITYSSENPRLSAFVVNTLAKQFIRYHNVIQSEQVENAIDVYAELALEKKQKLDELMETERALRTSTGTVSFEHQAEALVKQIADLELLRNSEVAKIPGLENTLSKIEGKFKPGEESYINASQSVAHNKVLELQDEIRRLTDAKLQAEINGDNSARLADSLSQLRGRLRRQISQTANLKTYNADATRTDLVAKRVDAELELEMSKAIVSTLDQELSDLRNRKAYMTNSKKGLDELDRDVELAQEEYMAVAKRLNEERLKTDTGGKVSQVEWVQPPTEPEPSKSMMLVALSAIVSLALCVVVLFVLEYIDVSIKFPSNFERQTRLDLMGVLNKLESDNLDLVSLFMATNKNLSLETYKQLLRKIRYEVVASGGRKFLLTSPRAGTGKTSILFSLAYSLSLNKKRVLLIDTNFKRNDLTRLCGAEGTLEKFLNNEITRDRLVSSSGLEGVDVIGCEGGNYTPSEAFAHGNFGELLDELAVQYDYIFMEGASLNTFADTKELTPYVDKVLPIFSARSAVKQADRLSIEYLKSLNGKLMQSVLNKVEMDNLNE